MGIMVISRVSNILKKLSGGKKRKSLRKKSSKRMSGGKKRKSLRKKSSKRMSGGKKKSRRKSKKMSGGEHHCNKPTRAKVWHGTCKKTSGGLEKKDLLQKPDGTIVSRRASKAAKSNKNLGVFLKSKGSKFQ